MSAAGGHEEDNRLHKSEGPYHMPGDLKSWGVESRWIGSSGSLSLALDLAYVGAKFLAVGVFMLQAPLWLRRLT